MFEEVRCVSEIWSGCLRDKEAGTVAIFSTILESFFNTPSLNFENKYFNQKSNCLLTWSLLSDLVEHVVFV